MSFQARFPKLFRYLEEARASTGLPRSAGKAECCHPKAADIPGPKETMCSSSREEKRWSDAKASLNPHLIDRTSLQKLSFQNPEGMAEASPAWGLACWQQGCEELTQPQACWPCQRGGLRELVLHYCFLTSFLIRQSSARLKVGIKCPTCLYALENPVLHFPSWVPHFLPAWTMFSNIFLFSFFLQQYHSFSSFHTFPQL